MTPVVADPTPQQQQQQQPSSESNTNNMACNIRPAEPREIGATVIASYPGSGAKLSWKTIRALTGIMTSDDYDHNGLASKNAAVAIKTHFLALGDENGLPTTIAYVPRAILLLRNPSTPSPACTTLNTSRCTTCPIIPPEPPSRNGSRGATSASIPNSTTGRPTSCTGWIDTRRWPGPS